MSDEAPAKQGVTSFDVARRAGVSRASVSRAFTPGANISPELRARVQAAAHELGYRVNRMAQGLNRQRSDLVGLIVARLHNPYRAAQVDALSKALLAEGLRPMLFVVEPGQPTDAALSLLLEYAVSGVIITSDSPPERICRDCAERGVPLLLVDRGEVLPYVDHIDGANIEGGAAVAAHLVETGHDRFLAPRLARPVHSVSRRLAAYARALEALGRSAEPIEIAGYDYASGHGLAETVADAVTRGGRDVRTAIFMPNDVSAIGLMDALRGERGLRVPGDISVVGFDGIPQAAWRGNALTTVHQSRAVFALRAVALLRERMADPALPPRHVSAPVRLVRRSSVRDWTCDG